MIAFTRSQVNRFSPTILCVPSGRTKTLCLVRLPTSFKGFATLVGFRSATISLYMSLIRAFSSGCSCSYLVAFSYLYPIGTQPPFHLPRFARSASL